MDHLLTAHLSRLVGKLLIILFLLLLGFLLVILGAFLLEFLKLTVPQVRRYSDFVFVGQEGGLVQKALVSLLVILFVLT